MMVTMMMAMAEMVTEMATAMAMATAMMLPLPPSVTQSMKTTAALQGRRLDNGDWTTAIGRRQWDDNNVMAMGGQKLAECLQVLHHPSKAIINYC
jgi:hypothetical protein